MALRNAGRGRSWTGDADGGDRRRARPLPALLVCHAGTIRVALALGLEGALAEAREISVPNAEPIAFDERLVLPGTR